VGQASRRRGEAYWELNCAYNESMGQVILIKRATPVGVYRTEDDSYMISSGFAFDAQIFREAPDMISCSSAIAVGKEWDIPPLIVMAMYDQMTAAHTN